MNIWLAISLILSVITLYLLTIEIFCVAFKLTGLATSKVVFQVGSLFTNLGFTTSESELVTNDKRRRKIALACAWTGNIFSVAFMGVFVNVFVSLTTTLSQAPIEYTFTEWYFILLYISAGFFVLVLILKIPPINVRFQRFLERIAINTSKKNKRTNIITVLDLYGKRAIVEVILNVVPDYAKDVPLYQMGLTKDYSINILSIRRGTRVLDVTKDTMFKKGDSLVMFGLMNDIREAFVNSIADSGKKPAVVDRTNEISLINNYGDNALVEVYVDEVPKELIDTKLKDARLNDKYNINIGVIKRKEDYIYAGPETVIEKGDVLTLFGPYKNIKLLFVNEKEAE